MSVFYRVQAVGGSGPAPVLITKNITANGTYNASSDSADGYDVVNVTVDLTGSVNLHSGKIDLYDGSIVADPDYYYTDPIPIPNGHIMFDLGYIASGNYSGVTLYRSDNTYYDYYKPTVRYRYLDLSSGYQAGDYLILCFEAAYLTNAILVNEVDAKLYAGNTNYHIYSMEV